LHCFALLSDPFSTRGSIIGTVDLMVPWADWLPLRPEVLLKVLDHSHLERVVQSSRNKAQTLISPAVDRGFLPRRYQLRPSPVPFGPSPNDSLQQRPVFIGRTVAVEQA
jgi:hypothetical protein